MIRSLFIFPFEPLQSQSWILRKINNHLVSSTTTQLARPMVALDACSSHWKSGLLVILSPADYSRAQV